MYGVPRPTTKTKRSLGPYQDIHIERNAAVTYGGYDASMEQPDARVSMFRIPITGEPTTVIVRVYLEANYAGTAPKLIVHQAGNTDVEATATGATGAWEALSVAYTPNAQPLELWGSVVSDNTAAALEYAVLWQSIGASGG